MNLVAMQPTFLQIYLVKIQLTQDWQEMDHKTKMMPEVDYLILMVQEKILRTLMEAAEKAP